MADGACGEEEGVVRLLGGGGAGAGRAMRAWPAMAMRGAARCGMREWCMTAFTLLKEGHSPLSWPDVS